jgi:2-methylaconitate cis-trans-isomerase PrpF
MHSRVELQPAAVAGINVQVEDTMHRYVSRTSAVALALGITLAGTTPALARGGGGDVVRQGGCSGGAHWKLKAKADNGRMEVEGEVDANRNGQNWHWRILHNGRVSARGNATTHAPSGSFSVNRLLVNAAGTDRIGWRAHNVNSGQTCRGGLRV